MSFNREKLVQRFNQEYKKLNPDQRKAVDQIEGPVMVIAGPGTGKTQILGARIARILIETDYAPQNILCLTYTDAGVIAMRKRLLSFIGPDAYKVNIHTFHSFCNMVIQENLPLFNKKELQPLNELERLQYLQELIDGFDKDNPLKRYKTDAYYDVTNLSILFSAIKKEGWTVQYLLEKIEEYISDIVPSTDGLYNKRESKKGNVVLTQKGKDEMQKMERLKAGVLAFPLYENILHKNHRYDFDDMINWVIRIFRDQPELLLRYQEQLQFFLVDEYQDTSGSQNTLVELLISYWEESPNLFVVGDDDQSIYRFQGANIENMMSLARKYERNLLKVVMTENYRSVQPLLDAARALITNNKKRLCNDETGLDKTLITAKDELKGLNISPVIREYENEFSENAFVAQSIKDLIDNGVEPSRIAVIYKEHKAGEEFLKFLLLQNVPYYSRRPINLLDDVFIKKVVNILKYLDSELQILYSGESCLFELLHYSFFKLSPLLLARISNELADNRNNKKPVTTFREYLAQLSKAHAGTLFSSDEETDELIRVHKLIEKLIKEVNNSSLQQLFELIINEAGILAWVMGQENKVFLLEKLSALFDYFKDASHRNPDLTLHQLVEQLKLLNEHNLPLQLMETIGTDDGVNLLTCHGSKGAEFEYVFLINSVSDVWEGKRKFSQGFRLPHNVFEKESPAEEKEELRRLFYVAITRAEKYLYISYPRFSSDGRAFEPSQFIEEICDPLGLTKDIVRLTDDIKLKYSILRFGLVSQPSIGKAEKDYVDRLLENFSMNITALNNYLDCPLKFYYQSLVKVPSAKSESMQFGSNVHGALSDYMTLMMESKRVYPPKDFLLDRFVFHMFKNREVFNIQSLERFKSYGIQVLSKYYDKYFQYSAPGDFIKTEYRLSKVLLDGIPLKGFADKIQFWKNDIVITDYKTGNYFKAKNRHDFATPGNANKPEGGNYWRQAVFYKILVDNTPGKNWKVKHVEFDFVEPNIYSQFDLIQLDITAEDKLFVSEQIKTVWAKIHKHDFYTGCGKPTCEWCNFIKNNKLYTALIEQEEETVEI